jgi:hypothetical protein
MTHQQATGTTRQREPSAEETFNSPISFEVSGSGVRRGSEVRPTPMWKRPILALAGSWRGSLAQLLLVELCSCARRIRARTRSHTLVFGFGIPPCPTCLHEREGFGWCDFLLACTHNTTQLQTEHRWMELLDVQMAVQSWIAGIEFGVRVCSESQCKEFPFSTSTSGSNSMLPSALQQPLECAPRSPSRQEGATPTVERQGTIDSEDLNDVQTVHCEK